MQGLLGRQPTEGAIDLPRASQWGPKWTCDPGHHVPLRLETGDTRVARSLEAEVTEERGKLRVTSAVCG